jgi:acylphosphatase
MILILQPGASMIGKKSELTPFEQATDGSQASKRGTFSLGNLPISVLSDYIGERGPRLWDSTMTGQRHEIWYQGHVQGVGFRYIAASIARQFDVTGFVQNLPDGRVYLVVEGEPGEVSQFLAEVRARMEHFIRDTSADRRPATGQFTRFEIRH